jgi:hypothetical protein
LENITHKKQRVCLNPNALDDALANWIPVDDDGDELCDTIRMDSVSTPSLDPDSRKHKYYKSSVGFTYLK